MTKTAIYKTKNMHTPRIAQLIQIWFVVMIIYLSVGCLHENRSGCSNGLSLKFRYVTSDGQPISPGFPETDHLSVFVFDGNGLFVCEKKDSAIHIDKHYTMELPFYEGQYQFVVWAGLSDSYHIKSCIPGQTPIQDLILQVKRENSHSITTPPSLLYYGYHETVTLNPAQTAPLIIGLQRITNTIHIIVHTENPDTEPQISIRDNNGTYNHQGERMPDDLLDYLPHYTHLPDDPGTWIADFNVMQLHTDSEARLIISSPGGDLQYSENLISGLLGANPDIDFNTDHDFSIEITFDVHYVPVSILINNWEIISDDID